MRNAAWALVGLATLGCGPSTPAGRDKDSKTDGPVAATDAGEQAGDAGSCPAASIGPISQIEPPRHTLAWTFAAADAGTAPDAGATPSEDAAAPSRCAVTTDVEQNASCSGGAWLRSSSAGPILTFDDGSTLTWNPSQAPTAGPYVQQASGDRVWADYERQDHVICPYCGAYTDQTLEIRDGPAGTVRFYAQQGSQLSPLPAALVQDIFGVTTTASPACTSHLASCQPFDRTELDHLLQTSPAQALPFATATQVSSPKGTYAVLWAATVESNVGPSTCTDDPGITNDDGFVATRLAP